MTELERSSPQKHVKFALYIDVMRICKKAFSHMGLNISKPAMIIIGDLVYKKVLTYGLDLEAFANHANRSLIDTDDVRLLVRRNPSLTARLSSMCPDRPAAVEKRKNTTSIITSKKRKIENPNNLPSTSRASIYDQYEGDRPEYGT